MVGGQNRRVDVGGGTVVARDSLLGVPGFSPPVVLHLRVRCSSVLSAHAPSVVRGSKLFAHVGGRIVSVVASLLGPMASRRLR